MTRTKKVFLYTVIIGILTHAFRMTNVMICTDTANYLNTISPSWVTSLGRFLLPLIEKIRGTRELPWLIGVICILLIGIAAILIAELFDIKGTISLVLLAWILVANPIVTSIFAYMYTADGYMIGLVFSVLAAFLCIRLSGIKGIICGAVALFLSMGFYQAFLSVTMMLLWIWLVLLLMNPAKTMKKIGLTMLRFFAMGGLGAGMYLVVTKIVWKVGGYGTTSYMGMNEAGGSGLAGIMQAAIDCYVDFARFFIVRWQVNAYNVMNVLLFLMVAVALILIVRKNHLYHKPERLILLLGLLLCLPFAAHVFEFISDSVSYTSTSMEYSLCLIVLLPIILWGSLDFGEGEFFEWSTSLYWKRCFLWIMTAVLLLLISFNYSVIANKAYYNMENANTKLENLLNRLETRMEMQAGYEETMEVAIIGSCYQIPEYVDCAPMMSGVVSNIFLSSPQEYVCVMNWKLSTAYGVAPEARMRELVQTEEFAGMKHWPDEDSVRIIDGTMVLYLSDNGLDNLYQ